MITKVTITGADDSITPEQLIELVHKYPFVEWGILVSKKSMGSRRFPSSIWINHLAKLKREFPGLKLSCHVCGSWVKQILLGEFDEIKTLPLYIFDRMQLNTHGESHLYHGPKFFTGVKELGLEVIFQNDNANQQILDDAAAEPDLNYSALFDLSHGFGKLPSEWPNLLEGVKCGYAGGLSPDNLEEQILKIEEKVGPTEIWIDMETHVRSDNDKLFDLKKVETCLEISSKYISK